MKQTILLSILLILLSVTTYSQVDSISNNLIPNHVDSIELSIWDVHTKEMSISNHEEEYEKELERITLSDDNQKVLITNFLDFNSYDQTRALIYHYNLVFELYHKGVICTRIEISTMTGNIDIENKLENLYFRNNCSEQLNKVLRKLLGEMNLIKWFDEIDLEGITTYNKK